MWAGSSPGGIHDLGQKIAFGEVACYSPPSAWILSLAILFDDELSTDLSLCADLGRKGNLGGLKGSTFLSRTGGEYMSMVRAAQGRGACSWACAVSVACTEAHGPLIQAGCRNRVR